MAGLIINADDLGLSASVNSAIFEVFKAGNLSSATLMVNMPGTSDAVTRHRDHQDLALGLHFCITEGKAITGPSSLTDEHGDFRSRGELTRSWLRGKLDREAVAREFQAQLKAMRSMGIEPTHTDSHQHIHMIPGVMDAIVPIVQDEGLAIRLVDPPSSALRTSFGRPSKMVKQWLNRSFAHRARRKSRLRANHRLVSIHDLEDKGPYSAEVYRDLVRSAPEGVTELMVHPYILGDDVLSLYSSSMPLKRPFLERCRSEFEVLSGDPLFPDKELMHFGMIE